jgi:hypothetical protein
MLFRFARRMSMRFSRRLFAVTGDVPLILLGLCCSASLAQVPQKKAGFTIKDREEWRKVLQWPDECERGFRSNHTYHPPGGVTFLRISRGEYVVNVGCGTSSIYIYYPNNRRHARLLKFREYDKAFGAEDLPYSQVNFAVASFDEKDKMLRIHSRTSTKNACLLHIYRFRRGRPVLVRSQAELCTDVF